LTTASTRTIALLPHQFDLIEDTTTRILGLVSGYGGGKTYAVARKACTLALLNPGSDGIITEPNFPLLTQILIPEVEAALEEFGIPFHFNKSEVIFYCTVSGKQTRIICKSMERYDRLIGVNAAWVILDEFDTAKAALAYSAFEKLMGRLRAGNVRQMVIVSTPEGFKAMHRIFVKDAGEGRRLLRARTQDNKHLPPDFIQSLLDTYPDELISAYLDGEFVNLTSGSVYTSYDREVNRSRETLKPGEPINLGMDFNVGNMAACAYVLRENDWHCVDEIKGGRDTPAMIDTIKDRWAGHHVTIYPDASGANASSKGASISDIGLLRGAGFTIRAKPSNPRVKDRILAVNMAFQNKRVFVNPDTCPETARCLEQQAYDANGEPDKKTGLDHQNDAAGYPLAYEMPVVKPTFESRSLRL
jgi:phage terminase large subunit-like protein